MQRSLIAFVCLQALCACGTTQEGPVEDSAPVHAGPMPPANASSSQPAAKAMAADPQAAHQAALAWLAAQQESSGAWPTDATSTAHKVGLTGLALLALQSGGSTMAHGPHSQAIARGVHWLMSQQDRDLGAIGPRETHGFAYDHAIATYALCTALKNNPSEELRRSAQDGVRFIHAMRNPYGAWRYDYPPTGDNDTSVTGWMVQALATAEEAGLLTDSQTDVGARAWINEVTDPATARIGYDAIGSSSSRVPGINDDFPTEPHEAMTASGMLTRMNTGEAPTSQPLLARHAQLLRRKLPEWDPKAKLVDEYYWFFGSLSMRRLGGQDWQAWRESVRTALLEGQSKQGDDKGSWEPAGPWAHAGGRVYATSLNALSLATLI